MVDFPHENNNNPDRADEKNNKRVRSSSWKVVGRLNICPPTTTQFVAKSVEIKFLRIALGAVWKQRQSGLFGKRKFRVSNQTTFDTFHQEIIFPRRRFCRTFPNEIFSPPTSDKRRKNLFNKIHATLNSLLIEFFVPFGNAFLSEHRPSPKIEQGAALAILPRLLLFDAVRITFLFVDGLLVGHGGCRIGRRDAVDGRRRRAR